MSDQQVLENELLVGDKLRPFLQSLMHPNNHYCHHDYGYTDNRTV